ncbi:MAG: DUF6798 domain-containing protein [Fimbriiglobus sp.]
MKSEVWLQLLFGVCFAVGHTQPWDYYSNQNQYYLHGFAQAGYGDLASDWLANTADPTPLFSNTIAMITRLFGDRPLHLVFFGLLVLYYLSLWGIVSALRFRPRSLAGQALFAGVVIFVHSGGFRLGSVMSFGIDYPWYLQAGLANQYLLGAGLQPSVFGVLLLTALALYLHNRPTWAAAVAAGACGLHSTYLLPAGLLVAGMMTVELWQREYRRACFMGLVALAIVSPVLTHIAVVFGPTDSERFAESQRILAWVRIPHHTDVRRWWDLVAGLQVAWVVLAMVVLRRSALLSLLGLAIVISLMLTGLQIATGSATLALLFPWRISAVLVPMATAVLAARLAYAVEGRKAVANLGYGLIFFALLGVVAVTPFGFGYQSSQSEYGMLEFVRENRKPGDLYLLPTSFPKPTSARGSSSSTFQPVRNSGPAIFELQRFRLSTGAAAYVDFKSIPYLQDDVLEWHRRVRVVEAWFGQKTWDPTIHIELLRLRITHVIVPIQAGIQSPFLETLYEDQWYRVCAVKGLP